MPLYPPAGGGGSVNFSAGTTSNNLTAITFSNSNGVSFGLNGSTMTASVVPSAGSLNFSAGTTSGNVTALTFADSNGISFGLNNGTVTGTVGTNYAGTGFTSTTTAGTAIVGTNNTAGLSLGVPAYLTTAALSGDTTKYLQAWQLTGNTAGTTSSLQGTKFYISGGNSITVSGSSNSIVLSVGNYLTTAALSQDSSKYAGTGFTSAGNNIGLSGTLNTAGLSLSATVAAQSTQSAIKGFGVSNTGQTAGNTGISTGIDWVMAGSNSITLSQSTAAGGPNTVWVQHPAWITTADLSQNSSKYVQAWELTGNTAGTTSSLQGTKIYFSAGSNITLSGSSNTIVISGATVAGQPVNFSAGTTSNNLGSVVFSNSNGVNFGLNGSTITASLYALSSYEAFPGNGVTGSVNIGQGSSNSVYLWPFSLGAYVSAGFLQFPMSLSFRTVGTSSGRQSAGLQFGIYTRNASTLSSLYSSSFSWGVTGNNSTYSISQVTTTNLTGYGNMLQTSSAGSVISFLYTGFKAVQMPVNALLTPGQYWFGIIHTNSTSSVNVGISANPLGIANGLMASDFAPIGSDPSASSASLLFNGAGLWSRGAGVLTVTTAALPGTIDFAAIANSNINVSVVPLLQFWSS